MPKGKGLYTRKGASGRTMYFRDGKLISEKSYRTSLTRRSTRSRKRKRPKDLPLGATIQGENIWHEEKWQYRILPLLEWLAA